MQETPEPNRYIAFALLAVGAGLGYWQYYELTVNGVYYIKVILISAISFQYGLLGLIEPKLLNPWHHNFIDMPGIGKYKFLNIFFSIIIFAIPIYFVVALEADLWLPDFVKDAITPKK